MSLEQRKHELEIEQARYDTLQEQRREDVLIAVQRHEQDKELARLLRENDRILAEQKQETEMVLEQQRYDQERARYLDPLLLSHIKELGQLVKENNGSLIANPTIHALVRAKTLNIFRPIGPDRSTQLILFLHETRLLKTEENPLDLSGVQLTGIYLSASTIQRPIYKLSLSSARLNNASFVGCDLSYCDFTGADLSGANLSRCSGIRAHFNQVILVETDFSHTNLYWATFDSNIIKGNFFNATVKSTNFRQNNNDQSGFHPSYITICEIRRD
ncbi:unnamed protein product [Rotaria sp. Silwood2]|nr:unnamed protein product [Rotaria sp. Silwood2]